MLCCSPPGSSVHGILQERTLECVALSFSRGSSRHRYKYLALTGGFLITRDTWEVDVWNSPALLVLGRRTFTELWIFTDCNLKGIEKYFSSLCHIANILPSFELIVFQSLSTGLETIHSISIILFYQKTNYYIYIICE